MNKLEKLKNVVKKDTKVKDYQIYEALYDYTPTKQGDLGLTAGGELRVVRGQAEQGWLEAVCATTGKRGFVPSNFIRKMPKEGKARPTFPPKDHIPSTPAAPIPVQTPPTNAHTPPTNTHTPPTNTHTPPIYATYTNIHPATHSQSSQTTPTNTPTQRLTNNSPQRPTQTPPTPARAPQGPTDSSTIKHYVALYDFTPDDSDAVSMKKGDRVVARVEVGGEGVGDGGEWVWARVQPKGRERDAQEGYVPLGYLAEGDGHINLQPWYFSDLGREEAQTLLQGPSNTTGAFLIREAQSSQGLSLSVRVEDEVKHYRIRREGIGREAKYHISPNRQFTCLTNLIEHYKTNAGLMVHLTVPCQVQGEGEGEGVGEGDGLPEWEIARRSLELKRRIGGGHYGVVYEGVWDERMPVAIKAMKPEVMEMKEFLSEAGVLKSLRHPCLVKMFGICSRPIDQPLYIVTELLKKGSLLEYLRESKRDLQLLAPLIQARIGTQIASGMSYLEELNYVHRDLAARNVLVGDDLRIKIADFGMARMMKEGVYEQRSDAAIATRWTAPEALQRRLYTNKSDVWSYGILLYEVVTHGEMPYPELENHEVRDKVERGYRMARPSTCATELYQIMTRCWRPSHASRPSFVKLKPEMERLVTQFST